MTNYIAAKLLVSMVSDLRAGGYDEDAYHEAVALACAALLCNSTDMIMEDALNAESI